MRRALAAGTTLALSLAATAAPALACPSCATREGPGLGVLGLVLGMIGVPYAVAAVAIRVVRRLERTE